LQSGPRLNEHLAFSDLVSSLASSQIFLTEPIGFVGPHVVYRISDSALVIASCRFLRQSEDGVDSLRLFFPPEFSWVSNSPGLHRLVAAQLKGIQDIVVCSSFFSLRLLPFCR
jgi:hypothetical protein